MDTKARLAIFAIVELICNGVGLAMLASSMSIKDRTVVGTSIEIERMPLT